MVDVGFGMKPVLTGQGHGLEFCSFIFQYVQMNYNYVGEDFRLTVATFNERAIHLYEKLGFVKQVSFNTGSAEFITMVKENKEYDHWA